MSGLIQVIVGVGWSTIKLSLWIISFLVIVMQPLVFAYGFVVYTISSLLVAGASPFLASSTILLMLTILNIWLLSVIMSVLFKVMDSIRFN